MKLTFAGIAIRPLTYSSRALASSNTESSGRCRRGFTLVELLVVVSIISVLMALLLPALGKARFLAKTSVCGSNQRQIYVATGMYANENNSYLPGNSMINGIDLAAYVQGGGYGWYPWECSSATWPNPESTVTTNNRWFGIGQLIGDRYLPASRVVACPDFQSSASSPNFSRGGVFLLTDAYNSPNNGGPGTPDCTYANSGANQGSYCMNTASYYNPNSSNNLSRGKIGLPGQNGGWGYLYPGYGGTPDYIVDHVTSLVMCLSTSTAFSALYPTTTHQMAGVNCTYIDGHVRWLQVDAEAWAYLTWGTASTANMGGGGLIDAQGFWPWASWMDQ